MEAALERVEVVGRQLWWLWNECYTGLIPAYNQTVSALQQLEGALQENRVVVQQALQELQQLYRSRSVVQGDVQQVQRSGLGGSSGMV